MGILAYSNDFVKIIIVFTGYYADMETGCQAFHICMKAYGHVKASFLCPNGSIFNQKFFTCDWWNNVDCSASERYYDLNKEIGVWNRASVPYNTTLIEPELASENKIFQQQKNPAGNENIPDVELLPPFDLM